MCTQLTKQQYIFLSAFGEKSGSIFGHEVYSQMKEIAGKKPFESRSLASVPKSLQHLFDDAIADGLIQVTENHAWRITDIGIQFRDATYEKYIVNDSVNRPKLKLA